MCLCKQEAFYHSLPCKYYSFLFLALIDHKFLELTIFLTPVICACATKLHFCLMAIDNFENNNQNIGCNLTKVNFCYTCAKLMSSTNCNP